jgi:hypothetical protein
LGLLKGINTKTKENTRRGCDWAIFAAIESTYLALVLDSKTDMFYNM